MFGLIHDGYLHHTTKMFRHFFYIFFVNGMKLILAVNVNFVILKRPKIMDIKINPFLDKHMPYKNVLSVNM